VVKITYEITVVSEHCCRGSRQISRNALWVISFSACKLDRWA